MNRRQRTVHRPLVEFSVTPAGSMCLPARVLVLRPWPGFTNYEIYRLGLQVNTLDPGVNL